MLMVTVKNKVVNLTDFSFDPLLPFLYTYHKAKFLYLSTPELRKSKTKSKYRFSILVSLTI